MMNTPSPSLQAQLLARVPKWIANFQAITQADLARQCGIHPANLSAAIAGRRGLSADSVLKLHKLLSLSRNEVIKKFSQPASSSKIVNFQRHGQTMLLDGWFPGTGGTGAGQDPNDTVGRSIDDTPDADTSMDVAAMAATLRQVRSIDRKAIRAINDWLASSKVNQGSTPPTGQRFGTKNIQKTLHFSTDNAPAATNDLLSVIGALDLTTRHTVIAAILHAFPN